MRPNKLTDNDYETFRELVNEYGVKTVLEVIAKVKSMPGGVSCE